MAHQRQTIREAFVTALISATAAGDRVFATRVLSLRTLELPAIAVYTLEESVDPSSLQTAPRELSRALSVTVEAWVTETPVATFDDAMDDISEQIETALHEDPYFAGACGESILADTAMEVVENGDRMMALVTMTYAVTYYTFAPVAPTLDDFETVEATHNLSNDVHADDAAVDLFTVEE